MRHLTHGHDEQISETVAFQSVTFVEPVLKEFAQQRFALGHGDKAVTKISGWQYAQIPPETARASPIVGHGDKRRQIVCLFPQPAQQHAALDASMSLTNPEEYQRQMMERINIQNQ